MLMKIIKHMPIIFLVLMIVGCGQADTSPNSPQTDNDSLAHKNEAVIIPTAKVPIITNNQTITKEVEIIGETSSISISLKANYDETIESLNQFGIDFGVSFLDPSHDVMIATKKTSKPYFLCFHANKAGDLQLVDIFWAEDEDQNSEDIKHDMLMNYGSHSRQWVDDTGDEYFEYTDDGVYYSFIFGYRDSGVYTHLSTYPLDKDNPLPSYQPVGFSLDKYSKITITTLDGKAATFILGMTIEKAREAYAQLGPTYKQASDSFILDPMQDDEYYLTTDDGGVSLSFDHEKLRVIQIRDRELKLSTDLGIGNTFSDMMRIMGRTQHKSAGHGEGDARFVYVFNGHDDSEYNVTLIVSPVKGITDIHIYYQSPQDHRGVF